MNETSVNWLRSRMARDFPTLLPEVRRGVKTATYQIHLTTGEYVADIYIETIVRCRSGDDDIEETLIYQLLRGYLANACNQPIVHQEMPAIWCDW